MDDAIFNELFENKELGWLELKGRIEDKLGRLKPISKEAYSLHLKRLVKARLLSRKDNERGKKVLYSITNVAREKKYLNILGSSPEQILLKNIYVKIFFFAITRGRIHKFEDMDAFLSEIGAGANDLHVDFTEEYAMSQGTFILHFRFDHMSVPGILREYPTSGEERIQGASALLDSTLKNSSQKAILPSDRTSNERMRQSSNTVIEFPPLNVLKEVYYKPINEIAITEKIYRKDAFKNSQPISYSEYSAFLPGISVNEIMLEIHDRKVKPEYIEKAVESLMKQHLIRYATQYHGEDRYKITDYALNDLIIDLQHVLKLEQNIFDIEFEYYREPNYEEKERLELLYGDRYAKEYLRKAKIKYFKFRDVREKDFRNNWESKVKPILDTCLDHARQELTDSIENVKKKHDKMMEQRYEFLHDVIGMVYPAVLQ